MKDVSQFIHGFDLKLTLLNSVGFILAWVSSKELDLYLNLILTCTSIVTLSIGGTLTTLKLIDYVKKRRKD